LVGGSRGSKEIGGVVNTLVDTVKFANPAVGKTIGTVLNILSKVGKLFLENYAPKVADLLFKSGEVDAGIGKFIDEIQEIHVDLADRNRLLLDELQDQFGDDRIGDLNTARDHLQDWINHSDPMLRMVTATDRLTEAYTLSNNVRHDLQTYISDTISDERAQFQRLQLLPLHIEATRLYFMAKRLYWNWYAMKITFEAEHGASSTSTIFEEWRDSLSQEEIDNIQDIADGEEHGAGPIFDDVLSFYENLSERDDVSNYVEAIFTPLVGHMETFNGNPNMYDDKDEMNAEAN